MKNKSLRKQLADSIRFFRSYCGYNPIRQRVTRIVACTGSLNSETYSVSDILRLCSEHGLDPETTFISAHEEFDQSDGCGDIFISLSILVDQTDEEYFDLISECLVSPWELMQYKQYLHLRKEFEGK